MWDCRSSALLLFFFITDSSHVTVLGVALSNVKYAVTSLCSHLLHTLQKRQLQASSRLCTQSRMNTGYVTVLITNVMLPLGHSLALAGNAVVHLDRGSPVYPKLLPRGTYSMACSQPWAQRSGAFAVPHTIIIAAHESPCLGFGAAASALVVDLVGLHMTLSGGNINCSRHRSSTCCCSR